MIWHHEVQPWKSTPTPFGRSQAEGMGEVLIYLVQIDSDDIMATLVMMMMMMMMMVVLVLVMIVVVMMTIWSKFLFDSAPLSSARESALRWNLIRPAAKSLPAPTFPSSSSWVSPWYLHWWWLYRSRKLENMKSLWWQFNKKMIFTIIFMLMMIINQENLSWWRITVRFPAQVAVISYWA